jgi:photosystem II stability/assembly factor-like uncharacterized protein
VTFVSPREGFVLGTAPCRDAPCITIARTLDRGATWRSLPSPVVPVGRLGDGPRPEAQGIRFATPTHGFVFGNGLWETADGGGHWAPAAYPGGGIISLATIDGQVLALISLPSRGPAPGPALGETLFRRPLGGGAWQPVTRIGASALSIDSIATHAGVAAVLDGDSVVVTVNGGRTFARHALPRRRTSDLDSAILVAPAGGDALTLVWNTTLSPRSAPPTVGSAVYTSDDLGARWAKAGTPPGNAYPYAIAAAAPGDVVIGMFSNAPWLIRSTDGGVTWASVTPEEKDVVGWADLSFTTPADGSAIRGPAGSLDRGGRPGQLLLTSDAGATWHPVRF